MKRALACFVAIAALAVVTIGASPASAGGEPGVDSYNEFFASEPFQVNGSYTPLVLLDACDATENVLILWYGAGTAPDHLWQVDDLEPLEYTSMPTTINGSYEPFLGDFDDDGCDDIFWYAPGSAADYIWYGEGDGSFASVPTQVSGTYEPLVGEFNDAPGDDIFWYAPGSAPESIWLGDEGRDLDKTGAPQVNGTYRTTSLYSTILFHAPGAAKDYAWFDVSPTDRTSVSFDINGSYTPLAGAESILLYGPGAAPDYGILDLDQDVVDTVPATVNGTYVPGVRSPRTLAVFLWHAPGAAGDYLWFPTRGAGA